jgi:hypothetical protein
MLGLDSSARLVECHEQLDQHTGRLWNAVAAKALDAFDLGHLGC